MNGVPPKSKEARRQSSRQALRIERIFAAQPGDDLLRIRVEFLPTVTIEKSESGVCVECGEAFILQQVDVCEQALRDRRPAKIPADFGQVLQAARRRSVRQQLPISAQRDS